MDNPVMMKEMHSNKTFRSNTKWLLGIWLLKHFQVNLFQYDAQISHQEIKMVES